MNIESNNKLAGPLVFEESVIRLDSKIREDNDGKRIVDAKVRDYVTSHKDEIFALQSAFFAELRSKAEKIKE
jgi:hypothetical protein